MTQFADDIRRIARGNRKKGALGIYTERDPVPGGTVFLVTNADLLNGNAPAVSDGSNSPEQQDQADPDKNKTTDPNNPNTFNKGGTGTGGDSAQQEGVADIADAIDGTAGPQMPTTGGGTSGTGGLRELTGLKDCETGKEFNLHLDGNFVPPEGWDDPDTPPEFSDYIPGKVWFVSVNTDPYYSETPEQLGVATAPAIGSGQWVYESHSLEQNDNAAVILHRNTITGAVQQAIATASLIECEDVPGVQACISPNPALESWPEDSVYDIAIKDGQFQTNEFDADAPDNFEPSGTKNFCYGEDGTGRAEVTADGGLVYYPTDANGAPTGTARVVDSSGQLVAAGDATDSFITPYLPQ